MPSEHRRLLSHRHPALYATAIRIHRLRRRIQWAFDKRTYATTRQTSALPALVKRHSTRLIKQLGDSDMQLQLNKVENLKLCIACLDGLTILPGETFSFCRTVGKPTAERGFKEGMELSMGKASSGIGGGICQMANLLHWLVLHSPLEVIERSTHSFDPFPDQNRSIPFGTGCAIFYNYIDFRFTNPTDQAFQIKLTIRKGELWGELLLETAIYETYKIYEKDHKFTQSGDHYYRSNVIWRKVLERKTGRHLRDEQLKQNHVRVMYTPEEISR